MLSFLAVVSFAATPPPFIAYRGIVNGASFAPPGMPNGGIARGSIFTILGSNLGPAGLAQVSAFPLQTTLATVSIQVTQGSNSVAAIPIAVTASQINAIMPSKAPLGKVSIQVNYNGAKSNFEQATVVDASFGIFAANSAGSGPGIVQNFVSATQLPINSTQAAAVPGQILIIWGTGLGAVADDTIAPAAGTLPGEVEVLVGGKPAAVSYAGRSPCCSGLDQIAFTVPADAPAGCYVPVQVRTGGATPSNAITIAISADGSTCADANNSGESALLTGGKIGMVTLNRYNIREDVDLATSKDFVEDTVVATFRQELGGPFAFHPAVSLPPAGTCTFYERYGGLASATSLGFLTAMPPAAAYLDAGTAITVQNVPVARMGAPMIYGKKIGATDSASTPPVFNPGAALTVSAPGGADVGSFTVKLTEPAAFDFNNRLSLTSVARSSPLAIGWTATSGTVVIVGTNYDHTANNSGTFLCAAPASAGTFTVPTYLLQGVPASRSGPAASAGYLMVGLQPPPASFSASKLDAGIASTLVWAVKSVLFQ